MNTDDARAFRDHARRKAAQELNETIRSNTPEYGRSQSSDQQAISDYEIRKAAEKFYGETSEPYDNGSR